MGKIEYVAWIDVLRRKSVFRVSVYGFSHFEALDVTTSLCHAFLFSYPTFYPEDFSSSLAGSLA